MTARSQDALIMLTTGFAWMMALMGYIRSSVRLFRHVNEILRDNSPWAYTHTMGFAANMISFVAAVPSTSGAGAVNSIMSW